MRPVTLDLSQVQDAAVKAALMEIQRASVDTLQNDTSSSGSAMATLIGAAADEIAYFTGPTSTAFTALSTFIRTLLGSADAATARSTLGAGTGNGNGNGSVTSIATTAPITGGPITTTGTIGFDSTALGLHLLNTLTASNSATLDDTTDITAAYDEYMFVLRNIVPATNNAGLLMRISEDAGATYKATTYDTMIWGCLISGSSGTGNAGGGETEGTGYLLSGKNVVLDGVSNNASYGVSGSFLLHNPNSATSRKMISGSTSWLSGGVARREIGIIGGHYDGSNNAINAVRFIMSAGNITSGTIKVYGIKTS